MTQQQYEMASATTNTMTAPEMSAATELVVRNGVERSERDTPSDAGRAMWTVLEHLEQALDHETSELMALRSGDLNRLNETKSRLLLDARRAVRAVRHETIDGTLLARLSSLRLKLEHNRLAIAMHLDAVRDIAAAMATTLMEAESDGTYSASVSSQVAMPLSGKARAV
jgi:hypothetical protein